MEQPYSDSPVEVSGFRVEPEEVERALQSYDGVKEAVVVARDDKRGEKRLIGYVVADVLKLKSLARERFGEPGAELVSQWKELYESVYSTNAQGPSFVGWNSSYTGQQIAEEQMHEWLQSTLRRIRALNPHKVLEIGCGVGLLLEHLAPECEQYVATDFSQEAVQQLHSWSRTRADLRHVQFHECSALNLRGVSGSYDTAILNSVVQYFPDVEYLFEVLRHAASVVSPRGRIFVGDVRNLGLLKVFHSSVQLQRSAAETSVEQLKSRVERAVKFDKELVIDSRFFAELPRHIPAIGAVHTLLKRGRADNELTRYRYDVVLHLDSPREDVSQVVLGWRAGEVASPADFAAFARERKVRSARLRGIPNRRLSRDLAASRLIECSDKSCTVGKLRELLAHETPGGEDPEVFWELGESLGYEVRISWSARSEDGCFDVDWISSTSGAEADDREARALQFEDEISDRRNDAYANDPLGLTMRQLLPSRLREYLREKLPSFMLPSALVILESLPLMANGKLDRQALPVPALEGCSSGEHDSRSER